MATTSPVLDRALQSSTEQPNLSDASFSGLQKFREFQEMKVDRATAATLDKLRRHDNSKYYVRWNDTGPAADYMDCVLNLYLQDKGGQQYQSGNLSARKAALEQFQKDARAITGKSDAVVGPRTWRAMEEYLKSRYSGQSQDVVQDLFGFHQLTQERYDKVISKKQGDTFSDVSPVERNFVTKPRAEFEASVSGDLPPGARLVYKSDWNKAHTINREFVAVELPQKADNGLPITLEREAAMSFLEMAKEYKQQHGTPIQVLSSYRDYEHQGRVIGRFKPSEVGHIVARQGGSIHEAGRAIDFEGSSIQWVQQNGAQWGWTRPIELANNPRERHHFEYSSRQTRANNNA